jgi:hypothetical protein
VWRPRGAVRGAAARTRAVTLPGALDPSPPPCSQPLSPPPPSARLATFYSRSRKGRWCKGETSGNFMRVQRVFLDCDRDSLVYLSDPTGPSCHTGARCARADSGARMAMRCRQLPLKQGGSGAAPANRQDAGRAAACCTPADQA